MMPPPAPNCPPWGDRAHRDDPDLITDDGSGETGMDMSHRNHDNCRYEDSPRQVPLRGMGGAVLCFFYAQG